MRLRFLSLVAASCVFALGPGTAARADVSRKASAPVLTILATNDDGNTTPGLGSLVQALIRVPHANVVFSMVATNQTGSDSATNPGPHTLVQATSTVGYPAYSVAWTLADAAFPGPDDPPREWKREEAAYGRERDRLVAVGIDRAAAVHRGHVDRPGPARVAPRHVEQRVGMRADGRQSIGPEQAPVMLSGASPVSIDASAGRGGVLSRPRPQTAASTRDSGSPSTWSRGLRVGTNAGTSTDTHAESVCMPERSKRAASAGSSTRPTLLQGARCGTLRRCRSGAATRSLRESARLQIRLAGSSRVAVGRMSAGKLT